MDIFGISDNNGQAKVMSADSAELDVEGAICYATGVNLQYGRQMSPVPTIGKGTHFSVGTPMGTLTIQSMVTGDSNLVEKLGGGEKCKLGGNIVVRFGMDCDGGMVSYMLGSTLCTAVSVQATAGQGYVVEGVTINFTSLQRRAAS